MDGGPGRRAKARQRRRGRGLAGAYRRRHTKQERGDKIPNTATSCTKGTYGPGQLQGRAGTCTYTVYRYIWSYIWWYMHKSLERLAAAPRSQGIPSLRHPETGASCTTDEAKAAALAAVTAAIARAREPATQEESASVSREHAALSAEWARPGQDAHGLGDEFTFDEVRGCMRSLKSHKAAGGDGIPAEVFKYSGGTGVQVLTHLFNAVLATRCVPSAWRKGIVVHLAKGGDAGDRSNCRPLTLLPIINKLFANLLSERIARVVRVHDQQLRSDLAEAHSIRHTTCWQSCGNELKLTKPHTRVSLKRQKLMTLYRTLSCSTDFSIVV